MIYENGKVMKTKTSYTLSNKQQGVVCRWLKEMKFSNGYALNVLWCIRKIDASSTEFKSYVFKGDCFLMLYRAWFQIMFGLH